MTKFKKVEIKRSPKKAIKILSKIAKQMSEPGTVKVGLPKGSNNYPDGTSVILVGTVQEFGSPTRNIPERSYLRSTMFENRLEYKRFLSKLGKQIVTGKLEAVKALNILGLKVSTDVKEKITEIKTPALKNREGNPLIDTGHLRQSITYVVNE